MIKVSCDHCGFEDIPENFNAFLKYGTEHNQLLRMIYIECPICTQQAFFQHFQVDTRNCLSISHLLAATLNEAKTPEEAKQVYEKKLQALKKKYSSPT